MLFEMMLFHTDFYTADRNSSRLIGRHTRHEKLPQYYTEIPVTLTLMISINLNLKHN